MEPSWSPRLQATHLSKGANGIWYMRLAIPEAIRARHPDLPKELKRSTKVAVKRLALAKAREMCLDFLVKYSSGTPMLPLDTPKDQSFALFYENGEIRISLSPSANDETVDLFFRCRTRMIEQIAGRGQRSAIAPVVTQPPAQIPPSVVAPVAEPTPVESVTTHTMPREPAKVLWLSDAIDKWLVDGGTTFSDNSWRFSYEPSFRVFRELVGDTRRERLNRDGVLENGVLDIEMHRLTRAHIEELLEGLKRLPPNQGKSTKESEARDRIREGAETGAKWPSLSSVDKKLSHVAPFISYAKRAEWLSLEVLDQMTLALESAKAKIVKANKKSFKKKGPVALSDAELKKMFQQEEFLTGAMNAHWRYWIPLICLYQGLRVSEASGLHTDDIQILSGVPCLSVIPDDPEDEEEIDGDIEDENRKRKVVARTSQEYRRVKNRASRRVMPIAPKLIELGFLEFIEGIRSYSPVSAHLFYGLTWEEKSMFGRKPSRYMRGLIKAGGFYIVRRKVPHSLRSNFHQTLALTLLPDNLQKRLLGHSTGDMKDEKYNETDHGPAFPFAEVVPYLIKMDFGLTVPTWSEVKRLEREERANKTLKRPVAGS